MNDKESVEAVRQICKDTFWEILNVEVLPVLLDYANGVEALAVKLKRRISELTKAETKPVWNWDPSKIRWVEVVGLKGKYERSEDVNNLDFKVLLKDLCEHNRTLTKNGYFYWVFENGSTVGRKRRG